MFFNSVALIWILHISLDTVGQVAFKLAAVHPDIDEGLGAWKQLLRQPWLWVGIACFAAEFIVWLAFLSVIPLAQGVLLGMVNIATVMICGRFLFKEHFTPHRLAGVCLIVAGVALVGV